MTNAPSADAPGRTAASAIAPACDTTQFTCAGRPVSRTFGHLARREAAADGLWLVTGYAPPAPVPNWPALPSPRRTQRSGRDETRGSSRQPDQRPRWNPGFTPDSPDGLPNPSRPPVRGQLAAAPSRSPVRPRVMPGSTGTPGPIVVEK